jgi:uncharacterized protein YkwD
MSSHRMVRLCVVAATALALVATISQPAPAAVTVREHRLYVMIDRARDHHGKPHIALNHDISRMARAHSRRMAEQHQLFHSCLACRFQGWPWHALGENVAKARTVGGAHRQLMNSPGHRANILGSQYRKVGVGIVQRGGWLWVTELFYG